MEETVYTIRFYQGKRKLLSLWKMTEAEAAVNYAGLKWEIVPLSGEIRRKVDPFSFSTAHPQGTGSR